ncbi:hypothetical protein Pmani_007252 [Petrolisthes manimaculis]|uniref:Uncharacterized protein n=1 Tax=Petrolisthes manimaculis TaxID=1843537 RepID=A0AAE1Q7X0_9EUCA|nr:hypothetical protein Pmani_019474 [Petrolisthes manimaculis]KAK4321969.1 hypothetical protein Pmani_007252 [Petrolisthes manimaculis]
MGRGQPREVDDGNAALTNAVSKLNIEEENDDIPQELIDPCKVFVGHLRPMVCERTLHEALSHYVTVEKVIIIRDKFNRRSKGYGFVTVSKPEDVDKLLSLSHGDRYISGQEMVLGRARKQICLPGHHDYIRQPLPDRDFDLSLPDPNAPSIHVLVDDVLYKILEFLPMRDRVRSERVCRRWQMLVHGLFTKINRLEIDPKWLGINTPITRSIISKLLILSGPTLKDLKLLSVDHATRGSIMKIVGQLCPVLQSLDVSMACGINFFSISYLTRNCRELKSFIAMNCPNFKEKALKHLLVSYPELERLHISGCFVTGRCFSQLPSTLKELNISYCTTIDQKSNGIGVLSHIGERCPHLETLEMEKCRVSMTVLEQIGTHCTNLSKLSLFIVEIEAIEALKTFKNLKDLTVDSVFLDLRVLINSLPDLQRLVVDSRLSTGVESDFSSLKELKSIKLCHIDMTTESVMTLAKCAKLEEVHLENCGDFPQEVLTEILKGCTGLKRIHCPNVNINLDFIETVNKIMEHRSGKLLIEVRTGYLTSKELLEAQYDNKKIEFDPIHSFQLLFDCDITDDDSLYSAGSLEDYWVNGFDGFDSDYSLREDFFYGDHLEFLRDPFLMYGFGYDSSEDSDFSI